MRTLPRRVFLQDTAALAAAMAAISGLAGADAPEADKADAKPAGPNDTLRVAVCGVNGRGKDHIAGWSKLKDVRITTICDVDLNVTGRASKAIEQSLQGRAQGRAGHSPPARRQVDRRHLDRHPQSLACPGDDLGLPGRQGRLRREAGQPQRQRGPADGRGRAEVRPDRPDRHAVPQPPGNPGRRSRFSARASSGRSTWPRGSATSRAGRSGTRPTAPVPAEVDYDLWLGPAPKRPFNPNRFHYNWHWNWDYGNGDLGNQGIHQMDLARWGLGKNELPKAVVASGGRFGYSDDGQTPNTLLVGFEFDDCELQFEVRGLVDQRRGEGQDRRHLLRDRGHPGHHQLRDLASRSSVPSSSRARAARAGGDHFANFVKAVKARDRKLLNADIEEGHLSSAYCHLGNIAYRLGRKLHINPSTESFVNDSEADAMLTREYRTRFVVPTKV